MRLILILGASGVGKTSVLRLLMERNKKLVYVTPHVTRTLRENEWEKVMVNNPDPSNYEAINSLYGNLYCTPNGEIERIIREGSIPVLDWPLDSVWKLQKHNPLTIYLKPPSLAELHRRLGTADDGRLGREGDCLAEIWSMEKIEYRHPFVKYVVTSIEEKKTVMIIEDILRAEKILKG